MNADDPTLASDKERNDVVENLQQAHVEGRLSAAEMDIRVEAAMTARTRGDLARLTADLPSGMKPGVVAVPQPVQPPADRAASGSKALRAGWASWAGVSLLTFVIWGITAITAGATYPWFLWVAGPWGAVMLMATLTQKFGGDDR